MSHTSHGIQQLKDKLREHSMEEELGTTEDLEMAAGRVIDAIKALSMGDWDTLCKALKKGLEAK